MPRTLRGLAAAALLLVVTLAGCGEGPTPATAALSPDAATHPAPRTLEKIAQTPTLVAAAPAAQSRPAAAIASDWSAFRGPTGQGISSATNLPIAWSVTENIAWKTPLPGPGASSPVVFGDRIYVTCYSGYFVPGQSGGSLEELKRHLVAVNRADGKILWDRPIAAKLPEEQQIRDHGFAASTPAVDQERIYVFFGKSGVIAFDHDGKQQWTADVGTKTHGWGSASSPVLYEELVFINASVESESLVALDRKTGEEQWRVAGIKESWNTPLVVTAKSGRKELVLARQGKVLAFDPATGKPLWSCDTDIGWYMVPSLVAHDDVVYCLGGRSGVASLAVRTGGEGDVTATHRIWTSMKGSNVSSPVFHDGHLYWAHDQLGVAYCAKAESGEIVYEQRLGRAGQVYSSALLAGGNVYYLTRDGKTFVIAAKPQFEQVAANDLRDGGLFNGSLAVDGQRLLLRSDTHLYCVGK
ncbi:MAG TPA: PQQ-binding-like beta-propeller repeat protein [Pirellulaceae bacterium]|nr:PQQ-binding-like beta-propeller repeat protein [Pirellulaceae bacterium]